MKYIYRLSHSHIIEETSDGNIYDTKTIGYFSSYFKACLVKNKYKHITGFADYTDGFKIEKEQIDFDNYDFKD